jgi:hypothetical protein
MTRIMVLAILLALAGCAYVVVDCVGMTGTCGTTSTIDAMTPVQVTVPVSAIPSI